MQQFHTQLTIVVEIERLLTTSPFIDGYCCGGGGHEVGHLTPTTHHSLQSVLWSEVRAMGLPIYYNLLLEYAVCLPAAVERKNSLYSNQCTCIHVGLWLSEDQYVEGQRFHTCLTPCYLRLVFV